NFIEKLENKTVKKIGLFTFYKGNFANKEIVAVISGVCKVNAAAYTQILISEFHCDKIIVSGVAGAIDNNLNIGDVVIAQKVCYHDVADNILTNDPPYLKDNYFHVDNEMLETFKNKINFKRKEKIVFGDVVTGEQFIDQDGREFIKTKFSPLAVDMETGAIAHVCFLNEIPFFAIRSITDTENESGVGTFEANFEMASEIEICLLKEFLQVL
ncbi:MAG: 5'-methylthioadenosine/S-adenosylhomocysteine nucleosidase, partial [Oscillospiraceae bacterium]